MAEAPLYVLRETPYGGHGLFAREPIKAGTRIMLDRPILSITRDEVGPQPRAEESLVLARTAQLGPAALDELAGLYHNPKKLRDFASHGGRACAGGLDAALVLAKFYTNAASVEGGRRTGLFATFCRMNHSCVPNTCWVYDEAAGAMEVYAVRDVAAGEEVTDSYTEVARSREGRARELANWGFRCACRACEGPDAEAIDARRRRVAQIRQLLDMYGEDKDDGQRAVFAGMPGSDAEALRLAQEAVSLLEVEGLVEELGAAHGWCAKFARRAGIKDVEAFHEEKEYEILVLTTG